MLLLIHYGRGGVNINENELMQYAVEIAKISYQQELDRNKKISTKTDYLIKYITILSGFLSLILKIIEEQLETLIETTFFRMILVISICMLIITIGLLLSVMRPKKVSFFPTGAEFLEVLKENNNDFDEQWKLKYYEVLQYSKATNKLEKANKIDTIIVTVSYIAFILAILGWAILIIYNIYT